MSAVCKFRLSHLVCFARNVSSFHMLHSEDVIFKSSGSQAIQQGEGEESRSKVWRMVRLFVMLVVTALQLYHNFPFAAQLYSIFMLLLSVVTSSTHN